jgi:hypothetical protein
MHIHIANKNESEDLLIHQTQFVEMLTISERNYKVFHSPSTI